MTLDDLKEDMCCNGYAYFNEDAFLHEATKVCYIPENAETLNECFTYLDLRDEVIKFTEQNPQYLIEHQTDINSILTSMFEDLSWEFPSTYLDGLNN